MRTKEEILKGEGEAKFMVKCGLDFELWCERVLGLELKPFHREWARILVNYDRIGIYAPTGFGKTTIFGVAYPLWQAYFYPVSQSLIISKVIRTQSANILEDIKSTIENNEILQSLLPSDTKTYWTKEKIITSNNARIFYSSYSINVRGVHVNYIFADEAATYPETRTFFENVITRVVTKKGKIAAVSTPVSQVDLMAKLKENKAYYFKSYPAIVNNESIWPERFPISLLNQIKEEQGDSNFQKNYMCNPQAEVENAIFPPNLIELCLNKEKQFTSRDFGGLIYIGGDFAIASGPTADWDCYIVVEILPDQNVVLIKHGEFHRGISVEGKVRRLTQLYELYNPQQLILDESHIGSAVIEELRMNGLPVESQSFHTKARNKLLTNLKKVIDNQQLVIPYNINDVATYTFSERLISELLGVKESRSNVTGVSNYITTTPHDDSVMALALACKRAIFRKEFTDFIAVA